MRMCLPCATLWRSYRLYLMKWIFICAVALLLALPRVQAQTPASWQGLPQVGAQVWLEPDFTAQQIDEWFAILAQNNMPVTRLFIMWNKVETAPGVYDWAMYDHAFAAAQKHGVGIVGTVMANFGPPHRGYYFSAQGGAIPKTWDQLNASKAFIKECVQRYRHHPALDTWMLMNEPGQLHTPDPLAMERFRGWLRIKYKDDLQSLNKAWLTAYPSFDSVQYSKNWEGGGFTWPVSFVDYNAFWRGHLQWYLNWVALQIREHDPRTPLHVNPHALLDITSRYSLPEWRGFLNSLGASIHPVWHFNSLKREEYATGISFVADMVNGASEPNPFWITELQGGHNIYSAPEPIRSSQDELARWLWTSVGTGADRTIFWCLNPRSKGGEAAEWSMLTFQNKPSPRLEKAAEITGIIKANAQLFKDAKPLQQDIVILLSQETMWLQERQGKTDGPPARGPMAHKFEALGFYKALKSAGYHPRVKFIQDLDIEALPPKSVIILPHATALTDDNIAMLEKVTAKGNKLIISGLSGMFDEEEGTRLFGNVHSLANLIGAKTSEIVTVDNLAAADGITMPTSTFAQQLTDGKNFTAFVNGMPVGQRNAFGSGEVSSLLTMAGTGAWFDGAVPLATWLRKELTDFENFNWGTAGYEPGVIIRYLQSPTATIGIYAAEQGVSQKLSLNIPEGYKAQVLYGDSSRLKKNKLTITDGETVVIAWVKQ